MESEYTFIPTDQFPSNPQRSIITAAQLEAIEVAATPGSSQGANYTPGSAGIVFSRDMVNMVKRKRHSRHSPEQIQELEAFFSKCNHPDARQRLELSIRIGLELQKVKFWFQNKRTHMKIQMGRKENLILRQENEKLQMENITFREAMRKRFCSNCRSPTELLESASATAAEKQNLKIMNALLKAELDRVRSIVGSLPISVTAPCRMPLTRCGAADIVAGSSFSSMFSTLVGSGDKSTLSEFALTAMEELVKKAQMAEPLWEPNMDFGWEKLNYDDYLRIFPPSIGEKPDEFVWDATRATGVVINNSLALVEALMNGREWAEMFPGIIASATTTEIVSHGVDGTRNEALQLMQAEFQVVSPLVPLRCVKFLRFCKQLSSDTWVVVDVSVENAAAAAAADGMKCRRLPSGCVVQDMHNGYSKVTWVEHTEYDEAMVHPLYRPLLSSGLGFGAPRWLAALQRHCDCLAVINSASFPTGDPAVITASGQRRMLELAAQMMANFCGAVSPSSGQKWRPLSIKGIREDVRLATRQCPTGLVVSAATSVWVPAAPSHVFDFLRNEHHRSKWDILSSGAPMLEKAHIAKGPDLGNVVSLLTVSGGKAGSGMLILQETSTDAAGSMIVYTPVDMSEFRQMLGSSGDPAEVSVLPSGFAIVPDGQSIEGSLLTMGFQILVNNLPSAKLTEESVETVNGLISRTLQNIKVAVGCCNERVENEPGNVEMSVLDDKGAIELNLLAHSNGAGGY